MTYGLPMELPGFRFALQDCGSSRREARLRAAMALAVSDDDHIRPAREALEALLRDEAMEVRAQAVDSLAAVASRGEVPKASIVHRMMDDPSDLVRAAVVDNLDALLDDWMELAMRASSDDAPGVRVAAASVLGMAPALRARPRLVELLADEDELVRRHAALAIGDRHEQGTAVLRKMVRDGVPEWRDAARVLGRGKECEGASFFFDLWRSGRFARHQRAVILAGALPFDKEICLPLVVRDVQSVWKRRRMEMLLALHMLPHASARTVLEEVARGKHEDEAEIAADIVSLMDEKGIVKRAEGDDDVSKQKG